MNAIRQDCYEIHLTKGYVALVDWEDADLCQHKWFAQEHVRPDGTKLVYAGRVLPREKGRKSQPREYLHEAVARRMGLSGEGHIDHENHSGCDNRRHNLRRLTPAQNAMNSHRPHRGVTWLKRDQKWRVTTGSGTQRRYWGQYETLDQALAARRSAEKELGL